MARKRLGRAFGWLWAAYAISAYGSGLGFAADDLLVANGRFESTTWSSIAVGPPLGGAAIGLFGYVTTVIADGLSYLLSALGITAIGGREPAVAKKVDATRRVKACRRESQTSLHL